MKKLIIITSPLYIRNYIETEAFKNIMDDDSYIACTEEGISNKESIVSNSNFVGEIESSDFNKTLFYFITMLLMFSNRKVNKGFYFYFKVRNTTIYFPSMRLQKEVSSRVRNKILQVIIIKFLEIVRPFLHPIKLLKFILILLIDYLRLTKKIVNLYNLFLFNDKKLKSIIKELNPDLVLVPNGGLDPNAHEVIALGKKMNYKTMLLVDNWDNLCSKSRFPINPDYMCVWGNQARDHANEFHQIDGSKVFCAGTPRFDVYQNYKNNKDFLKDKYQEILNFPYILFAGCWPQFDEIGVLEILNDLMEKHKKILPQGCKILYRPHPWGENYDKLDLLISKGLKNIAIDPQMAKKSRPDDWTKRTDFQPKLDYYPFLLDKSEFVICPLSSVLIEASLMDKKVLALAHDDGKSFLNPSFCYKNSDYFEGLERINSTKLLFHIENLDMLFKQMITIDMQVDREALSYYIIDDNELYPDRIANICRQLILN